MPRSAPLRWGEVAKDTAQAGAVCSSNGGEETAEGCSEATGEAADRARDTWFIASSAAAICAWPARNRSPIAAIGVSPVRTRYAWPSCLQVAQR